MSKRVDNDQRRLVRIETWSDQAEFHQLVKELEKIQRTHVRAELFYPSRRAARYAKRTGAKFSAPPPYEIFMWVVTTANGLIKLAEVVRRFLRKRRGYGYEGKLIKAKSRSAVLKFNGKEISIKGNWSRKDLQLLLEFSKPLTTDRLRLFEGKKRKELANEIRELRKNIDVYRRLVSVGDQTKEISPEGKETLRKHKKTLRRFEDRLQMLEEMKRKDVTQKI